MKVLVVGMGKSGYAAAKLAIKEGHSVLACDQATTDRLSTDISPLLKAGLVFYGGSESPGLLQDVETVILSPGVPVASPLVRAARQMEIPVLGEPEWAFRHSQGSIVAVTGSNGKSTTTTLIAELMAAHLPDVRSGGNLGTPFSQMIEGATENTWYVLEMSSFQLESIERFHARVAVLLNVTPDHQDRYSRFEDYQAAKARVFLNQAASDTAVYSMTDPVARRLGGAVTAKRQPFSAAQEMEEGAFVRGEKAFWRHDGREEALFSLAALHLPGVHNLENALASAVAARCAGVPEGGIEAPLGTFTGLPHRLEKVGVVKGVPFYNDSKATNTDAVLKALTAFRSDVILMLGGLDKGADWKSLSGEIERCCKAVYAFGAARPAVEKALAGAVPIAGFPSLREATAEALSACGEGDTVLLSPACASFDEFRNFEDRGNQFRAWVKEAMTK
jgi:UDP-N-acetylmuramoylalanine--D-glutamate ligase